MRKHLATATLVLVLVAGATGWVAEVVAVVPAQQAVDQTRTADSDADIEIRSAAGAIRVIGWDRSEVRVTGTLGRGSEGLELEGDESDLTIEVALPSRRQRPQETEEIFGSELDIYVPHRASVEVDAEGASVQVSGVRGELTVYTFTGPVRIAPGPSEIDVETASGEIHVEADSSTEEINLLSGSGSVTLSAERAEVYVETVGGTIEAIGNDLRDSSFESTAGTITFEGSLSNGHTYEFDSFSGNIVLALSGEISATFEASTYAGTISSDFGPEPERAASRSQRRRLEFTVGDGRAEVTVESHSGSIEIRRR